MKKIEELVDALSDHQKEIILKANEPGSTILFNIKGMVQLLHEEEPFDFVEMGYQDIEILKNNGLLDTKRSMEESHVLQGEEYGLSALGKEVASALQRSK